MWIKTFNRMSFSKRKSLKKKQELNKIIQFSHDTISVTSIFSIINI